MFRLLNSSSITMIIDKSITIGVSRGTSQLLGGHHKHQPHLSLTSHFDRSQFLLPLEVEAVLVLSQNWNHWNRFCWSAGPLPSMTKAISHDKTSWRSIHWMFETILKPSLPEHSSNDLGRHLTESFTIPNPPVRNRWSWLMLLMIRIPEPKKSLGMSLNIIKPLNDSYRIRVKS